MAERHEFTTASGHEIAVAFDPRCPQCPDVFGEWGEQDITLELLRVVAERDEAKTRAAAQAVEQCRRLAEEMADQHDENADRYGGGGSRSDDWPLSKNEEMKAAALRDFVRRIEDKLEG